MKVLRGFARVAFASVVAGGVGALLLPAAALGQVHQVTNLDDSGAGSLRAAIAAVVADNDEHCEQTIEFAPGLSGTLELSSGQLVIPSGVGCVDDEDGLLIDGPGADVITIDAGGQSRVLHHLAAGRTTIRGLTFTGGVAERGGGIAHERSWLVLEDVVVTGNRAEGAPAMGGGIYVADTFGTGAVYTEIVDSEISGNTADGSDGAAPGHGQGGGVYAGGSFGATPLTISGSAISGNRALGGDDTGATTPFLGGLGEGGGVWAAAVRSSLSMTGTTVDGNAAEGGASLNGGRGGAGRGGGVNAANWNSAFGSVVIRSSTLSGNEAIGGAGPAATDTGSALGGGVNFPSETGELISTTVSGNSAEGCDAPGCAAAFSSSGGGLAAFAEAWVPVRASTFSGNSAERGASIFAGSQDIVSLESSIVAGSAAGDECFAQGANSIRSLGYNVAGDASCSLTGAGDQPTTDPELGPLAGNGGPTPTHMPSPESPAVDQGTSKVHNFQGNVTGSRTADQRGQSRIHDWPAIPDADDGADVGAVEVHPGDIPPPPVPVNVTAPSLTGSGNPGTMLTCDRGEWTSTGPYSYEWLLDDSPAPVGTGAGQTGSTNPTRYRIGAGAAGSELICQVTRTNSHGASEPAASNVVTLSAADAPQSTVAPALSGPGRTGAMLDCDRGQWTGAHTYTYAWLLDGELVAVGTGPGQTGTTNPARFRPRGDAVGLEVVCRVTATSSGGTPAVADSNAVTVASSNVEPPQLTGTGAPGTLLACTPGTWIGNGSFSYAWTRDGESVAIGTGVGETGSTNPTRYRAEAGDAGSEVICHVTRTDIQETVASNPITLLATGVPENTDAPVLSGYGAVGAMLTCNRGEWTSNGTYSYEWTLDGEPVEVGVGPGQTGSTNPTRYRAKASEIGLEVRCHVTRTNAYGPSAPAASNAVEVVR